MIGWLADRIRRSLGIEPIREVRILASVLDDLCAMSRSAVPNEMLAYVSSTRGVRDGILLLDEIQLQAYDATVDSASAPLHLLPTVSGIQGTVHSHPDTSARPSDADLDLFNRFGLVHGIIARPYTRRSIRWYDKEGRPIRVRVR